MKNKFIVGASVMLLSLTACGTHHYEAKDYILNYDYHDNFRILQLSDTHIGDKDDQKGQFDFIDSIIKTADPDMIVVTGDLFSFASRMTAKRFFDFLESHEVPWTVTFGNHDEQCYFSIDWMTKTLNNYGKHCLFKDIQDDDITGNANFAINLNKDGKVFEQVIVMDSNRYYYGDYFGYDFFKENQIKWYSDLVDYTTTQNGGTVVDSLMFYHIPLYEIDAAYEKGTPIPDKNGVVGVKKEDTCPPKYNSGFFEVIKNKASTKAMFFGHDHINNFRVEYEGVVFSYGLKSDNRVYYDEEMLGGQLITIKPDHSLEYEFIFKKFGEAK